MKPLRILMPAALLAASLLGAPLAAQQPPEPAKPAPAAQQKAPEPDGVVAKALSWLGIKYRFGGTSETKGFDCAGLVKKVFSAAGVILPRTAAEQFRHGCAVAIEDLRPGDLVFFQNTYKKGISHVGIYIGERLFVHAGSHQHKVVVDRIDMPYYLKRFAGGRRIPTAAPTAVEAAKQSASAE
ncbi:MAG TPA: C40 family peptidase [Thermoanaerobaculia bacterium]|nr:C40 family peptidase [Thermoanaerobaculia bacterium]